MKSSEYIAKDLGYYFIGDGQMEEFLTPWMVKQERFVPGQVSTLHCPFLPFYGLVSPQMTRAELVTLWFMALS